LNALYRENKIYSSGETKINTKIENISPPPIIFLDKRMLNRGIRGDFDQENDQRNVIAVLYFCFKYSIP
jgi:hypothetical protein